MLSPDFAALIKNLWFSESKFALRPASFNSVTNLLIVISPDTALSLVLPSTVTVTLPSDKSPIPLTLLSLELPLSLASLPLSSVPLISPPVRYPVAASLLTLSVCVPFTAEELAVTLAYELFETVAVFKL